MINMLIGLVNGANRNNRLTNIAYSSPKSRLGQTKPVNAVKRIAAKSSSASPNDVIPLDDDFDEF